ncbi:MAG: ABC transporter ATP-binding protein [Erysipelothrix sp.]|nr:ABC transporter ATP-binding protein [Erysipelothrix sp.]
MITFSNVKKSYGEKLVLQDINWDLKQGTCYGLVGANGSGKSTLLRLLSGVIEPDAGLVEIDGMDVFDNPNAKKKIFFLGDEPYFFNQSTIKDMKQFYQLFYPNFDNDLYLELLNDFNLNEKVKINSFSKGMKRQVVLILALACKPDILLLDEAFDGLDPIMRFKLRQYISQIISDNNAIIIISSHNLRELEDICDNIALINNNVLQLDYATIDSDNIYHKYQVVFEKEFDMDKFKPLNPLNVQGKERIFTIVLKGNKEALDEQLNKLNPMIIQHSNVSLEEIFIYEVERSKHEKTI